jgi:hypothetical protein
MSEVDTGFQQFFDANAKHKFSFGCNPEPGLAVNDRRPVSRHPAEHGIKFDVVAASPFTQRRKFRAVCLWPIPAKKRARIAKSLMVAMLFLVKFGPFACQTHLGALLFENVVA